MLEESIVHSCSKDLNSELYAPQKEEEFDNSIRISTNGTKQVKTRFSKVNNKMIPITHGYAN